MVDTMVSGGVSLGVVVCVLALACIDCTHIYNVDQDFARVNYDQALAKDVDEVLTKIRGYKMPLHPRLKLFYQLLLKAIARYTHRSANTLYFPITYSQVLEKLKDPHRKEADD